MDIHTLPETHLFLFKIQKHFNLKTTHYFILKNKKLINNFEIRCI